MELSIVQYMQQLGQGTVVDALSQFISRMPFLGVLWVVIIVMLILRQRAKWKVVITSFALSAAVFFIISEWGLKHLFIGAIGFRERPYIAYAEKIMPIGASFADTSFPSDHMASTLAMLTTLLFFIPGTRPFALVFALMMAFSRMHNGMHYPSDVAVGALLGIGYGLVGSWLARKIIKNKKA